MSRSASENSVISRIYINIHCGLNQLVQAIHPEVWTSGTSCYNLNVPRYFLGILWASSFEVLEGNFRLSTPNLSDNFLCIFFFGIQCLNTSHHQLPIQHLRTLRHRNFNTPRNFTHHSPATENQSSVRIPPLSTPRLAAPSLAHTHTHTRSKTSSLFLGAPTTYVGIPVLLAHLAISPPPRIMHSLLLVMLMHRRSTHTMGTW